MMLLAISLLLFTPFLAASSATIAADSDETVLGKARTIPLRLRENGVDSLAMTPADSTRIINGQEVSNQRYPYTVSLQYFDEHFCGGALIAPDIVITAGHCNGSISLSGIIYNVVIGRHNLNGGQGQSIKLKKEVRHPQYDEDTVDNDFNLVILSEPVTWGNGQYLRVNDDPQVPAAPSSTNSGGIGDALTVVGWGDTDIRDDVTVTSDILLETEVYAIANDVCEQSEGTLSSQGATFLTNLNDGITENMLCARADGTDACQGDSGGPLIKKGNDESGADDTLVGIVSWGLGCADEDFPGVYSRVSAQYDWIQSNVCELSSDPPAWFNCPGASVPNSASPTNIPTPQPTWAPLADGKRRLLVIIKLDASPVETGWRLTTISKEDEDANENVIFEKPIGSYSYSEAEKSIQYVLLVDTEGFYNFTIYDTKGDGFGGSVSIYEDTIGSDWTLLVEEPGFSQVSGTAVSHGFYVGTSPEQFLTLSFIFDSYAHEVAYEIKNDNDGTIFALAWFQSFDQNAGSATMSIPIYGPKRGDQTYTIQLWDAGSDGICCTWGVGGYQLFLGDDSDGALLKSGGDYDSKETFQFIVEGDKPLTLSPTSNPTKSPTPYPTISPSFNPSLRPSENPTPRPFLLALPPVENPRSPSSTTSITALSPSSTSSVLTDRPVTILATDNESSSTNLFVSPAPSSMPPTNYNSATSTTAEVGEDDNTAESPILAAANDPDTSSATSSMMHRHTRCWRCLMQVFVVASLSTWAMSS